MKPFFYFFSFILVTAMAWSQTPVPNTSSTITAPSGKHDRMGGIQKHMNVLNKEITQALKSGQISAAEAKTLRKEVLAVHHQMHADFHQNGGFNLNDSEETQLIGLLNQATKDVNAALSSAPAK